ncbi:tetratricopeptide repeat protein [Methylophaga thalassica]
MMKAYIFSMILGLVSLPVSADVMQSVADLQHDWAKVNYTLTGDAQEKAFESLIEKANSVVKQYPEAAESHIWRGIIESSYAGAKGGLGALSLAKAAKADLEEAMKINDTALDGSAYTSLGTLYAKVPGWPIGFGDDDKAEMMLKKALTINPTGIDSNYFYAQYLIDNNQYKEAETYLLKAQQAPARPSRPLADKGRQQEIEKALQQVRYKLGNEQHAGITH